MASRGTSLRDVAALAGVSVKTVSNVVNGYAHVTEETRERVQRAIEKLGYRPNLSARALRSGKSGIIALAVPELAIPYFAELASAVVRASEEHAFTLLIDQTNAVPEREREVVAGLRSHLIDGLIYSPIALSGEEIARSHGEIPLVLLGERVAGGAMDHVAIDNVAAATEATAHLVGLGRRRIAAIGYQRSAAAETARLRARGYEAALRDAGMRVERRMQAHVPSYHRADGAAAMAKLLEAPQPPDAVFCFNDLLALGAIRCLLQRGLRVPEDVAVVGFDDIEEGRYATPSLTTIRPDKDEIARVAVDYLLQRIAKGDGGPAREHVAGHELVVRESSAGR